MEENSAEGGKDKEKRIHPTVLLILLIAVLIYIGYQLQELNRLLIYYFDIITRNVAD